MEALILDYQERSCTSSPIFRGYGDEKDSAEKLNGWESVEDQKTSIDSPLSRVRRKIMDVRMPGTRLDEVLHRQIVQQIDYTN